MYLIMTQLFVCVLATTAHRVGEVSTVDVHIHPASVSVAERTANNQAVVSGR